MIFMFFAASTWGQDSDETSSGDWGSGSGDDSGSGSGVSGASGDSLGSGSGDGTEPEPGSGSGDDNHDNNEDIHESDYFVWEEFKCNDTTHIQIRLAKCDFQVSQRVDKSFLCIPILN